MKKLKIERRRFNLWYILLGIGVLYLLIICFKFPALFENAIVLSNYENDFTVNGMLIKGGLSIYQLGSLHKDHFHRILQDNENHNFPKSKNDLRSGYGRLTSKIFEEYNRTKSFSKLEKMVDKSWSLGLKEWENMKKMDEKEIEIDIIHDEKKKLGLCSSSISLTGEQLSKSHQMMMLKCGLSIGSSITIIGTPRYAHQEYVSQLAKITQGDGMVFVSQFIVELHGSKSVIGEESPKILHINPRLRGDWSFQPVIEHNTCYRKQWGTSQRCDGLPSQNNAEMLVDGKLRCEKWMRNTMVGTKDSKIFSWFQRFIGRSNKPEMTWPFPFIEGRMFVLIIRAGLDGFHINVGSRHVTSFPYRTGFTLEDVTGLLVKGDVDIHSVYATSLPIIHPRYSPENVLDFSEEWKTKSLAKNEIKLFIGVLSATNHFSARMAIRKTWMCSSKIKSQDVVVRFFVALSSRRKINAALKKEADYFNDIVILPFMDHYDLVILKTISVCEYGVRNVTAKYIMKCDDDSFVRVDTILKEIEGVSHKGTLYMGNFNLLHRPIRTGKWAVSYEEWGDKMYPPYANGVGYIISIDIAKFIVDQHQNHILQLFKMEDVSIGMWVEKFNNSKPVQYSNNWKFVQHGCVEDYYVAHYQSPRQMICLWENLIKGQAHCCNV